MNELWPFLKGMMSKDSPQSFARSGCMFIIYFKVCESLYIVSKTTIIPDIPLQWAGLIALLYGSSKWADVVAKKKGEDCGPPAAPTGGVQ